MNPKITFAIHTASPDSFLRARGLDSAFQTYVDCLERQTFRDFEFVLVDTYYEQNREKFATVSTSFPIKHVPVHAEHRYWYDRGNTFIAAAKNTGLLYADGELFVTCDDGELFPEELLRLYWDHYRGGRLMHALHKRMKTLRAENGRLSFPIEGDTFINDNRWPEPQPQIKHHDHGQWLFAGTSCPVATAVAINGFNERMDGYKSLEDCEFGTRLHMAGCGFLVDTRGFVYIPQHPSYVDSPEATHRIAEFVPLENYGVYQCTAQKKQLIANRDKVTAEDLEIIRAETLKFRSFDIRSPDRWPAVEIWLKTPTFDIKRQREELRQSHLWRW